MSNIKTISCATDGCETTFKKRSNRHMYCDECRKARQRVQYEKWYAAKGQAYYRERYANNKKDTYNGSITNEQS